LLHSDGDCKARGVEYKPPRGRRKIQDPDIRKGDLSQGDVVPGRSSDDEQAEISDTDSLSDLYPGIQLIQIKGCIDNYIN